MRNNNEIWRAAQLTENGRLGQINAKVIGPLGKCQHHIGQHWTIRAEWTRSEDRRLSTVEVVNIFKDIVKVAIQLVDWILDIAPLEAAHAHFFKFDGDDGVVSSIAFILKPRWQFFDVFLHAGDAAKLIFRVFTLFQHL